MSQWQRAGSRATGVDSPVEAVIQVDRAVNQADEAKVQVDAAEVRVDNHIAGRIAHTAEADSPGVVVAREAVVHLDSAARSTVAGAHTEAVSAAQTRWNRVTAKHAVADIDWTAAADALAQDTDTEAVETRVDQMP